MKDLIDCILKDMGFLTKTMRQLCHHTCKQDVCYGCEFFEEQYSLVSKNENCCEITESEAKKMFPKYLGDQK